MRARPLRDRQDLVKTNFSIGEDKVVYNTAAMNQFRDPTVQQLANQSKYINHNTKVHVITGEIMDVNQKMAGYERFTE